MLRRKKQWEGEASASHEYWKLVLYSVVKGAIYRDTFVLERRAYIYAQTTWFPDHYSQNCLCLSIVYLFAGFLLLASLTIM